MLLDNNATMFEIRFSPFKSKFLLQDCSVSTSELKIKSKAVEHVDQPIFVKVWSVPVNGCQTKSQHSFRNLVLLSHLRYLWRRQVNYILN